MNEQEQERFEAELRRASPALLPKHLLARLQTAKPGAKPSQAVSSQSAAGWTQWWQLFRWLAPTVAALIVAVLLGWEKLSTERIASKKPLVASAGLKANDVQVDQELVSSFDVVATLPGGEPVRFRCSQWKDQLLVTDKSRGVEIEENSPRVEVVPVRFETY